MARKKQNPLLYNFYISGAKFNLYLEINNNLVDKSINGIIKELNLDLNIQSRFKEIRVNGIFKGYDLTSYQLANSTKYEKVDKDNLSSLTNIVRKMYKEVEDVKLISESLVKKEMIKILENKGEIKVMGKVLNIAIDNGNSAIKVCYGGEKTFKFDSKISTKFNEFEVLDNNAVQIDGEEYSIIANPFDDFIKGDRKADMSKKPLFAFSICKVLEELNINDDVVSVNIAILNPVNENSDFDKMKSQVNELNDTILRYKTIEKKEWKEISLKINNVICLAEGVSSYMALDNVDNNIAIIDIGSKTTNFMLGNSGNVLDAGTINKGTDNYFKNIASINSVNADDVKEMINVNTISHNATEYSKIMQQIFNDVKRLCNGFNKVNNVYFTGGGTALANELGVIPKSEKIKTMDNPQFTNIVGAYEYLSAIME